MYVYNINNLKYKQHWIRFQSNLIDFVFITN